MSQQYKTRISPALSDFQSFPEPATPMPERVDTAPALVIDLDGTLLKTDLLFESALAFLRRKPLHFLYPFIWLWFGKANLKHRLAEGAELDLASLPYEPMIVDLIRNERAKGRTIVLATASHRILAEGVAQHFGVFDRVLATEGSRNLSAHAKRDLLVHEFGERGFDYAGNSCDDLPVWRVSRVAYVVDPRPGVERRARAIGNVAKVIRSSKVPPTDWARVSGQPEVFFQ
jgi:phosphoserine phosphatase